MLVVPPPSRYPTSQAGNTGAVNGQPLPYTETTNVLSHPSGLEYQLSVGEGTYVLRDDLLLATPPPYPSDAPLGNPNILATTMSPPTAGTRLSLTAVVQPQSSPRLYTHKMPTTSSIWSSALKPHSIKESPRESRKSEESSVQRVSSDAGTSQPTGNLRGIDGSATPAFGEGNTSLIPPSGKDSLKRRKPKTNIIKRNSSFVSRVLQHDALPKRLQERNQEGLMVFANINRAFQWLDFSTSNMADNLTKILFSKAHALCHDVNPLTRAPNHIDTVIGFSSGDIFWYEPTSQKYARLNKNGIINPSPVSDIRWIPRSENLFLAAHMDGSLVVYDKEKEDAAFIPEETETSSADTSDSSESDFSLHVSKSVNSKNQKNNPISCWKLSNQRINAFSFSPDSQHLAVVSEDGSLRVIDYLKEQLLDIFPSYYGGFLCVSWSPDGKYIVTGGQDDLVSIWSLAERQIVARCQGHQSFVTAVAFDPWRCDERNYRFGSVGEDCRLLLWDFGVGMLRRPKTSSVRQRSSVSSYSAGLSMPTRTRTDSQATARYRSNSSIDLGANSEESVIKHPVGPRARTAMLPPVMSKAIDPHPLSWLGFEADCIITSCKAGHIRTWDRPREGTNSDL